MSEWKREETSGWPKLAFVRQTRRCTYTITADPPFNGDNTVEFSADENDGKGSYSEVDVPLDVLAEVLRHRGWKVEAP